MEPLPQRKPLRLPGYDYSQNGAYFVTLCTEGRQCLFDMCPPPSIVAADSRFASTVGADSISARVPVPAGSASTQMVQAVWRETVASYPGVLCPKHVLMPNHFHALLVFDGGRTGRITQRADMESAPTGISLLSQLIQSFKRHTTIRYIALVLGGQAPPFQKRVWQRSFYDHVIRSQADYERIWQYIDENPAKWADDTYYKETTP